MKGMRVNKVHQNQKIGNTFPSLKFKSLVKIVNRRLIDPKDMMTCFEHKQAAKPSRQFRKEFYEAEPNKQSRREIYEAEPNKQSRREFYKAEPNKQSRKELYKTDPCKKKESPHTLGERTLLSLIFSCTTKSCKGNRQNYSFFCSFTNSRSMLIETSFPTTKPPVSRSLFQVIP